MKTSNVRIKIIFDSESAPLKTLGDRVSKTLEAYMLINLNFSDETHERFCQIVRKTLTIQILKLFPKLCPYEFSMLQILNQK